MIYFIGGLSNREFKYFDIIESIRKNNQGIQESFFDVEAKEEDKFFEKISFNSIFSLKELIVLKRAEKLKNIEKILDYILSLDIENKEIVIDYSCEEGKFPSKLVKKIEELKNNKKIEVYLFLSSDDGSLKKYIETELKINEKESSMLIEMIGNNPFKVKNEVRKISIYLNGEKFDINEIKKIICVDKKFKLYEMTANILTNNPKETMSYLEETKEYMGILYSLYSELEDMYKLKVLVKEGYNFSTSYNKFKGEYENIKEIFKVNGRSQNSYSIFKKIERTKNYTINNLRKLIFRCWEIEKDIKNGKIEMETGVELLIIEIVSLYKKDSK